jgi:hypothetical protein
MKHFKPLKQFYIFGHWQNEKLSEMLSMIRKRLQSILACIFALITFDNRKKWPLHQRSAGRRKNSQETSRKLSMFGNLLFGKMLLDPDSSLESTVAGEKNI